MKICAYVILAGILVTAITAGARAIYVAGGNAVIAEQQDLAIKAQNKAIEDARAEWEATHAAAEVEIRIEERIVEKIRIVERDVPRVVEKIVELTPECRDLGDDYAGLLNAAVNASNHRENSSTDPAATLDDTL